MIAIQPPVRFLILSLASKGPSTKCLRDAQRVHSSPRSILSSVSRNDTTRLTDEKHSAGADNHDAMIDYGRQWRKGKPTPPSRAESLVNNLVNTRTNKRRQMRWSLHGAHRVLQVRTAVLDDRFATTITSLAA